MHQLRKNVYLALLLAQLLFFGKGDCDPILFAMPPKTASTYIPRYIARGLNQDVMSSISIKGGFPSQEICPNRFKTVAEENLITRGHVDASRENIDLISTYGVKTIVSVRDIRQNVVSWAFHVENLARTRQFELISCFQADYPKDFLSWEFPRKLDWYVENYVPATVAWIEGWLKASKDHDSLITFVTYEDFVNDREAYVSKILGFLGASGSDFCDVNLAPTQALHFRKGKVDEWKEILTPEQVDRVMELVPPYFFELFHWEL